MKASVIVHYESTRIKLEFPYKGELISKVRQFEGIRWSQSLQAWHIPYSNKNFKDLLYNFPDMQFDEEDFKEFLPENPKPAPVLANKRRKKVLLLAVDIDREHMFCIRHAEDDQLISITKCLPGITWNNKWEGWVFRNTPANLRQVFSLFKDVAWVDASAVFMKEYEPALKLVPREKSQVIKPNALPVLNAENEARILKFCEWLRSARYSSNTLKTYSDSLRIFFRFLGNKHPDHIDNDDLIEFNNRYILAYKYSASFQNQVVNAIKLYFKKIENRRLDIEAIQRPRRAKKLPNVLSKEEVEAILKAASGNSKHQSMLALIYSCGLRRSELINLRLTDVDSKRGLLIIRDAKGKKDRITPLSEKVVALLRNNYRLHRTEEFLFEGWVKGSKYSERSLEEVLKKYVKLAGIHKPVTLHWLRHSYATHLLENGTDLRYIQELLGHKSSKTTEIYTHVSNKQIQKIKSPFDDLNLF